MARGNPSLRDEDLRKSPKPDSPIRLDMWMTNFADRLERHGDKFLDPDMEPFRGFLAGVGFSDRVDELRKMAEAYRKEYVYKHKRVMDDDRVHFHIKAIAGRLLTIIDAMMGANEKQCEAMKTVIRKEFRAQFDRIFKETYMNDGAAQSESSEDAAVNALQI
jgi:hypothetical protein